MNQRGAVALLLAMAVLAMTAGAAFQVHRTVLREWAMEGEALQGTRAALAADSALAWFLKEGGSLGEGVVAVPERVFPEGQDGEIRVRRLGQDMWKLTITGRCRVRGGGKAVRTFCQVREAYVLTPAPGGVPVLKAWRSVH